MNRPENHFVHECERCVYLGEYRQHDLYFCTKQPNVPTVLARYGNDPSDYVSGVELATRDLILAEAVALARARNLLPAAEDLDDVPLMAHAQQRICELELDVARLEAAVVAAEESGREAAFAEAIAMLNEEARTREER
jgi:hypothetical protein